MSNIIREALKELLKEDLSSEKEVFDFINNEVIKRDFNPLSFTKQVYINPAIHWLEKHTIKAIKVDRRQVRKENPDLGYIKKYDKTKLTFQLYYLTNYLEKEIGDLYNKNNWTEILDFLDKELNIKIDFNPEEQLEPDIPPLYWVLKIINKSSDKPEKEITLSIGNSLTIKAKQKIIKSLDEILN